MGRFKFKGRGGSRGAPQGVPGVPSLAAVRQQKPPKNGSAVDRSLTKLESMNFMYHGLRTIYVLWKVSRAPLLFGAVIGLIVTDLYWTTQWGIGTLQIPLVIMILMTLALMGIQTFFWHTAFNKGLKGLVRSWTKLLALLAGVVSMVIDTITDVDGALGRSTHHNVTTILPHPQGVQWVLVILVVIITAPNEAIVDTFLPFLIKAFTPVTSAGATAVQAAEVIPRQESHVPSFGGLSFPGTPLEEAFGFDADGPGAESLA